MNRPTYRTQIPLFDELRGKRVLVRPYREDDAQALFEAVNESRERLRPWMPWADTHQTVEESRDWIIHQMANWLLREDTTLGMWDIQTQRYLGGTGLHPRDWDTRYFEIGYWIRPSAEGHGYVTEAARLLTDYAFESLKANRVEIRCDERNVRSAAIPQRLGFTLEGRLRNFPNAGGIRNVLIFSLIPEDWQKEGRQGTA
jgi:RimJ/RimL family protein N-acetyltransferase